MDPARTVDRVVDHIRRQGFFVVEDEPSAEVRRAHALVAKVTRTHIGLGAVRTPMDLPISQEVIRDRRQRERPRRHAADDGRQPADGSVERPLGTRTIVIPIANHDDHQHSFDENLRIQNLWDGIELMAALMTM